MSDDKRKPERINIDHILNETGDDSGDDEVIEIVDDSETGEAESVAEPAEERVEEEDADPGASAVEDLLEEALREKEELQDRCMRALADLDNYRKRVEREREEQRLRISIGLIQEILPALDDLGRALSQPADAPGFREGIELIQKQFDEALKRLGIEPIDALGESFDPVYHEALSAEPREGFEPNTVIEEIRKGYTLGGRVVRPSLVKVVIAAPQERSGNAGESGEADGTGHRD